MLFLKLFDFLSPAGKIPRIATSGDDARVGSIVPSTPTYSSKGTGTTQPLKTVPAGISKDGDAGDNGNRALVVGALPKLFVAKKFSMKRAPV